MKSPFFLASLFLSLVAVAAGCAGDSGSSDGSSDGESNAPSDKISPDALRNPSLANATAPDKFRARFRTTKGDFIIESERKWSPHGVDRLYNLIRIGYFNETPFYRIVPRFVAQFGFHPDPSINAIWQSATIPDDENIVSNSRGYLSFAKTNAPNTRSVQLFINLKNNASLDSQKFATVARIVEGWDTVIAKLNSEYGARASQGRIQSEGGAYIDKNFPNMDKILSAAIIK